MAVEHSDAQAAGDSVIDTGMDGTTGSVNEDTGAEMEVFKSFTIEAAHKLPNVPDAHPCARVHGHSFVIELWVSGFVGGRSGWVIDFAEIVDAFRPLNEQLDHRLLNDLEGLANPTSENLAIWIWERVSTSLRGLSKVVVRETATSGCVYRGPRGR
jgi:6-pyruvoyltetrahydropterin/6-carboxytetrahydropterin synthase